MSFCFYLINSGVHSIFTQFGLKSFTTHSCSNTIKCVPHVKVKVQHIAKISLCKRDNRPNIHITIETTIALLFSPSNSYYVIMQEPQYFYTVK